MKILEIAWIKIKAYFNSGIKTDILFLVAGLIVISVGYRNLEIEYKILNIGKDGVKTGVVNNSYRFYGLLYKYLTYYFFISLISIVKIFNLLLRKLQYFLLKVATVIIFLFTLIIVGSQHLESQISFGIAISCIVIFSMLVCSTTHTLSIKIFIQILCLLSLFLSGITGTYLFSFSDTPFVLILVIFIYLIGFSWMEFDLKIIVSNVLNTIFFTFLVLQSYMIMIMYIKTYSIIFYNSSPNF
ncbi:hypothetical protein [Fusobacterium sp. PH5-44]|uniref:hypothetical protein n=1 Tax=unclassified Fusobacterium TaxID=2648384 RepID=UPI003D228BCB